MSPSSKRNAPGKPVKLEALEGRQYFYAFVLYNADSGQPIGPFENNTTIVNPTEKKVEKKETTIIKP